MNDAPLLDYIESSKLARRHDPETSHEAAEHALKFRGDHHKLILNYLASINPRAAHYIDIAEGTGLDKHAVARRLPELRDAGLVFIAGSACLPGTSRKGTLYRVAGKAARAAA